MRYFLLSLLFIPALLLGWFSLASSPETPAPATAPNLPCTELGATQTQTAAITGSDIETPATGREATDNFVVVELFTSQGCSSCPPADKVLRELATEADVIALSFHVDYWNYLGWKDPFSDPDFSARQRDYTDQLRARTYTPQLVINGRDELVGSRRDEVKAKVALARKQQNTYTPELTIQSITNGAVTVNYQLAGGKDGLRVTALLVQNGATSSVKRGENKGRELSHGNVVRAMDSAGAGGKGSFTLALPEGLKLNEAQIVILIQETGTQAIVGAARSALSAG